MNQPPQAHVVIPANDYIAALRTARELVSMLAAIDRAADNGLAVPALVAPARKLFEMVTQRLQDAPTHHVWIDGGRVLDIRPRPPEGE